ncbi:hypothetical protein [Georgenia thermotolerans]|uniref:Uncharacterized protein n=1 Tax=Georgenia thermotolerans TaxID=527326 RepID=A0A7J5UQC1_9MICO|nr:hypothetical protein [Georgenia thermotolerans]KAE8764615.1 hypothetical protein GB883_08080 [Georgenia thermotolerans]
MSPRRRARRLPAPPRPAGRVLDARLHLLDRQVLDVDDVPVTTVDDLEVEGVERTREKEAERPHVTALVTGPVLGTRIFGGRPPENRWIRVPWSDVSSVDVAISLGVPGEGLEATWRERWVRDHIIRRIPGGGHAPQ